jgi:RHS repeat-associated protein
MSSQSDTVSQIISAPQGGGALHGIGEKFSPDLFTGTGNFTVPIALPPGRNGFQPQLNLVYSTGNGNSPFGLGWALNIPGVTRKTSKGIPRYQDEQNSDVFILSGSEDLVPVETIGPGITRYQPRTEGLFARIIHHQPQASVDNYWEVKSKDGLTSLYGTPTMAGNDGAVTADPRDGKQSKVFAWKLTRTTDPFNNVIEYVYERDKNQTEGVHHWDQLYLSEIHYVDYGADRTNPSFLVTVKFTYTNRLDPFSDYRAGFEIRTVQRCTEIDILAGTDGKTPVRTYHLDYIDQQAARHPELQPLNGASLLYQIRVEGQNGANSEWLPPLEFGYTQFQPKQQKFFALTGSLPAASLADANLDLVDLFGAGLPDILEVNGSVRYWRNKGGGEFALPHSMQEAPAGVQLSDKGVQIIDANGDARPDLLVTTEAISGYYPLQFGGLWDRKSFQPYGQAPSFDSKDPEVRLVDLDGDGITDAIRSGTSLECYFNDPKQGWNNNRLCPRKQLGDFPNVDFSDPRVKWADMTGDGLQDIVLVYDGLIQYWPNLGYGNWGRRVTMAGIRGEDGGRPFPWGYDPRRILAGDIDGDGLADIVYVDNMKVTLWINRAGNGWSDPIPIEGTPPVSDVDSIRLTDINGNGVSGVLWTSNLTQAGRPNMFFLDLTGGIKPYLLNQINNHIGAVTDVTYKPSTWFYLQDEQHPASRWITPLPFPVQVVASVKVTDQFSESTLTTEYSYHHGYWDGFEREFRGFGRVDQRDTQVFTLPYFSPPTETRTWFHQGNIGDPYSGWKESNTQDGFVAEYFSESWPSATASAQVLSRPPSVLEYFSRLKKEPSVMRDALRSMRGRILRTELYALDGTARQDLPYTVTEHVYSVRQQAPPNGANPPVFFPFLLSERTTQWERGSDPLTTFKFSDKCDDKGAPLDYDAYGQSLSHIDIAVPRGQTFAASSTRYLTTQTVTTYAQPAGEETCIVDRVSSVGNYDVKNDGSLSVFALVQQIQGDLDEKEPIGHTLNFYDGNAFQGLPFGKIGTCGALVRTDNLVFMGDMPQTIYGANPPPYIIPGGTPTWSGDYPQEFQTLLPPCAGYTYQNGGPGSVYQTGYYRSTELRKYDFQDGADGARGFVTGKQDPLGHQTTITPDQYYLLPATAKDEAGLITKANYDYRVFQPSLVTDPNGNQSQYAFSPLGLLQSIAVTGKPGENIGDTSNPSTVFTYVLFGKDASGNSVPIADLGQPVSVRTVRRVHHDSETDIAQPARDETIETLEYSDGFGRLLQTRTQAEDQAFAMENIAVNPGLVGWWQFNEGSGTQIGDSSGKNNNGTLSGAVGFKDDARFGTVLDFTGTDGGVYIPQNASLEPATGTIGGWAKIVKPQDSDIVMKVTTCWMRTDPTHRIGGVSVIGLRIQADGSLRGFVANDDRPDSHYVSAATSPDLITLGEWHHLVMRWDGNTVAVFVDGVQQAATPYNPIPDIGLSYCANGNPLGLGVPTYWNSTPAHQFTGQFADFRYYGRGCSDAEIWTDFVTGRDRDALFGNSVLPATQPIVGGDVVVSVVTDFPRVVVSGEQVYDNKGQAVEKYEPFFSTGWDYAAPTDAQLGQKVTLYYDPRGHVIRTANPDGSEQRVVFGVPGSIASPDLTNPDVYEPTPWEAYTYDANDNAGRTHPTTATAYQQDWNTPSSIAIDALGRTVRAVERNRDQKADGSWSQTTIDYTTVSTYDIVGNLLTVTDALGRLAFKYTYDLAKHALRTESIDAGTRVIVLDAAGNEVERRDTKGALILHAYDKLNRPIRMWARDAVEKVVLRERMEYGDAGDPNQPPPDRAANRSANRLGRLSNHYDEAGLLTFVGYDFKGNLLDKTRNVITESALLAPFNPPPPNWVTTPFRVDWGSADVSFLDSGTAYETTMSYDALNRVKTMQYPKDVEGGRKLLVPQYNRAGALEAVQMDGTTYVERIAYNAKGQRILISYGNGFMTRYAYDPKTFRLLRMRTEKYTKPSATTYHPSSPPNPLQEFGYEYDLVGNILNLTDLTPGSGVLNNPNAAEGRTSTIVRLLASGDALIRHFTYDPLYRLVSASGRESDLPPPPPPWNDIPRGPDFTKIRLYSESYQYDKAGNMGLWSHTSIDAGGHSSSTNRQFALVPGNTNNQLSTLTIGDTSYQYAYDPSGNLLRENTERHFEWDQSDRMRVFRIQPDSAPPSKYAQYLYDSGGRRVMKLVRVQSGGYETTIYVDEAFEHQRSVSGGTTVENNSLHVMDNRSRIAIVRVGDALPKDGAPDVRIKYQFGDHLGSSNVVVDDKGAWINREEYLPYGETSFGSFGRKRYRFTGKERDEESGLYYHGARYYAPWLARWTACDPRGIADGLDVYAYSGNNPVCLHDPDGTQAALPHEENVQASLPEVHGTPREERELRSIPEEHSESERQPMGMEDASGKLPFNSITNFNFASLGTSNISGETLGKAMDNLRSNYPWTDPVIVGRLPPTSKLGKQGDPLDDFFSATRDFIETAYPTVKVLRLEAFRSLAKGGSVDFAASGCPGVCLLSVDVGVGLYLSPPRAEDAYFNDAHLFLSLGGSFLGISPHSGIDWLNPNIGSRSAQLNPAIGAGVGVNLSGFLSQATDPEAFRGWSRQVSVGIGEFAGSIGKNAQGQITASGGVTCGVGAGAQILNSYTIMSPGILRALRTFR